MRTVPDYSSVRLRRDMETRRKVCVSGASYVKGVREVTIDCLSSNF